VAAPEAPPRFAERPTEAIVRDGLWLALPPAAAAAVLGALGLGVAAGALALLAGFVLFFFRNPARSVPGDERTVVAPADGTVIEVAEGEEPDGGKVLRIGIFLSVFDVHVNRAPLAGRVLAVEREPGGHRAAFRRGAERENARLTLTLETAGGERVRVVQIVGWVARRIVCHPKPGEWIARGARYGLMRFGSRTDVLLPPGAEPLVSRGRHVRGGASPIARLAGPGQAGPQ
jgi:phosphatidylserine decarboxylase